jgi:hypothetical protein
VEISDDDGVVVELEDIETPYNFFVHPVKDNRYYISKAVDSKRKKAYKNGSVTVDVYNPTPVKIVADRTVFLVSEGDYDLVSDPAGGRFSGPGVTDNKFDPEEAGYEDSPHTITCKYTNQGGCVSTDQIQFRVLSGIASVAIYEDEIEVDTLCNKDGYYDIIGTNKDGLNGSFRLFESGSSSALEGYILDEDLGDNRALLQVDGLEGEYRLEYTCSLEEVRIRVNTTFRMAKTPLTGVILPEDTLCKNADPIELLPETDADDPDATYHFSGPGVTGSQGEGYFLDPAAPEVSPGETDIQLEYVSSSGCRSFRSATVWIAALPQLAFQTENICLSADGGSIQFINQSIPKEEITSWEWDFGDPESGADNQSALEEPGHFYPHPGTWTIGLKAVTRNGCRAELSLDTYLEGPPEASIIWDNECYMQKEGVNFMYTSVQSGSALDEVLWTISDQDGNILLEEGGNAQDSTLYFAFPGPGNYQVMLRMENQSGCTGQDSVDFRLLAPYKPVEQDFVEDFNGEAAGWNSFPAGQGNSWTLEEANFYGYAPVSGDYSWHTRLPEADSSTYLEQSWVQSPCFDLSGMKSPTIQLDYMRSLRPLEDGAVLQFRVEGEQLWRTLGAVGSGFNWYNLDDISNQPGGSPRGWGLASFTPDESWKYGRLKMEELINAGVIVFRIALASGASEEMAPGLYNQGFAFDNFRIGEAGTRRSVLEYFTNVAGGDIYLADTRVKELADNYRGLVYDLHYHMEYPEEDPMFMNNEYLIDSRSFLCGLTGVPYAALNGGADPAHRFHLHQDPDALDEHVLVAASLENPIFDVALSVDYLESGLQGHVNVVSLDYFAYRLDLRVAVIEKEVIYPGPRPDSLYRNVVLDMIPSPAGEYLGKTWGPGSTASYSFQWEYPDYVEDVEDLMVIAFVQEREQFRILQAAAVPHTQEVGIRESPALQKTLSCYPNPATGTLHVRLEREARAGEYIQVMDISGKEMMHAPAEGRDGRVSLDVSELPEGVYLLYWKDRGTLLGHAKFIRANPAGRTPHP